MGISKMGQRVVARLMESEVWHQLAGSVGEGFRKRTVASACLDTRPVYHGCLSSCYLVLELRGSESE